MSWSTSLACPAGSAEGIPSSLISSRRRLVLPGRGRLRARAGRAERPGDGRGSGSSGPAMGRGYAAGREARWRATRRNKAPGQRSIPSRAGVTACGREPLHPRPGSPAGSAFSGRTTPDTRPPDRDDSRSWPFPQLRRRHVLAAEMPIYQA